jgi:hypothetical protein
MATLKQLGYIFLVLLAGLMLFWWGSIGVLLIHGCSPINTMVCHGSKPPSILAILFQDPEVYAAGVPLFGLFIAGLVVMRRNYRLGFFMSLAAILEAILLTVAPALTLI